MGTTQEFFDGLAAKADTSQTAGMNNSYAFDIEGAGQWTVKVDDGAVAVEEGMADGADCTISTSQEVFEKIVAGEQNPTSAYMTGKLKLKGDMGAAMKLQKLFLARKRYAFLLSCVSNELNGASKSARSLPRSHRFVLRACFPPLSNASPRRPCASRSAGRRVPRGGRHRRRGRPPQRGRRAPSRRRGRRAASPSSSPRSRRAVAAPRPRSPGSTRTRITVPGIGALTVDCLRAAPRRAGGRVDIGRRTGRRRGEVEPPRRAPGGGGRVAAAAPRAADSR